MLITCPTFLILNVGCNTQTDEAYLFFINFNCFFSCSENGNQKKEFLNSNYKFIFERAYETYFGYKLRVLEHSYQEKSTSIKILDSIYETDIKNLDKDIKQRKCFKQYKCLENSYFLVLFNIFMFHFLNLHHCQQESTLMI